MYQSISFSELIFYVPKGSFKMKEFNIITIEDQPHMDNLVLV